MQPKKKTRKRRHTLNQFILRSARERGTENRDNVPMGPSRGYVAPEGGSRKIDHDGVVTCYGNGASSTGGRQEAENDRFTAYCSQDNDAIPSWWEKAETGDTTAFAAHARERGDLNQ